MVARPWSVGKWWSNRSLRLVGGYSARRILRLRLRDQLESSNLDTVWNDCVYAYGARYVATNEGNFLLAILESWLMRHLDDPSQKRTLHEYCCVQSVHRSRGARRQIPHRSSCRAQHPNHTRLPAADQSLASGNTNSLPAQIADALIILHYSTEGLFSSRIL